MEEDVISGIDETIENGFDPSQPLFLSPQEETPDSDENACCPLCKEGPVQDGISCDTCKDWYHQTCLNMSDEEFELLTNNPDTTHWFCVRCLAIQANNIKWGKYEGEIQITNEVKSIYSKVLNWRKNIFPLPRGKCGNEFIKELTRLINLFTRNTEWKRLALSLVHIFIPLMLQKPNIKSKPRDHSRYLTTRLERWKNGELTSLLAEAMEIQRRMRNVKSNQQREDNREKLFIRQMMLGKLGAAAKYINNDDSIKGVHPLTAEIIEILESKHPTGREVDQDVVLECTVESPQPVLYEGITSEAVYKIGRNMSGSGGPTLVDTDTWKDLLCSKAFGNASTELCQSIADLAKLMCTEEVHPDSLIEFNSCRLVPLDKGLTKEQTPGVRPIGIGEVLRRIVGKLLIGVIKTDIIDAVGPLQTCAGLKGGIEAAIHAMREMYERDNTEGILLVDAENAFNNLNREVALQNIKQLCPPFYQYLNNTYQKPANLVIQGEGTHEIILSKEGCIQGGVEAMDLYGLGISPLIDNLADTIDIEKCIQVWYADDSSTAGELEEMKKWWDTLCSSGPKYGYFPLASKTILIVKAEQKEKAIEVFGNSGVTITTEGERHMGAVIGSEEFKKQYVERKISKWIEDIEALANIAKDEPQAAYSCYTKAISHRWTYIQRTIPNIAHLFEPLEKAIRDTLIPKLVGRIITETERKILALPVKLGGMGIYNPTLTSDIEFRASHRITRDLTGIICRQEKDLTNYNKDRVAETIKQIKIEKGEIYQNSLNEVLDLVDEKTKRILALAQEKGVGSWLTTTPTKSLGFALNKQEFLDSICLRYGWRVPNTPSYCQCNKKNDIDHALSCHNGGYSIMRHNRIRDLEAELMQEVCKDVKIEPQLLPVASDNLINGNTTENARLDVSGLGVWSPMEKTFLDIRVMHPNCPSYINKDIGQVYKSHEREKKRSYNERVIQIEKGTFTPIVFSTFGGMGHEADKFHKRLAQLISEKRGEEYSHVINFIRTRLRFCLLKSVLTSLRGIRGRNTREKISPISTLSFNLIQFED